MRAFGMVMSFVMKNELYALSEASLQMALNLPGLVTFWFICRKQRTL